MPSPGGARDPGKKDVHGVAENANDFYDLVGKGLKIAKHRAGYVAFYSYDWIEGKAIAGARGLTGLVRSKEARITFNCVSETGEAVERHLIFIAAAMTIAEKWKNFERILDSKDTLGRKAGKLSAETAAVVLKTLVEIAPNNPHLLYKVIDWAAAGGDWATAHRYAAFQRVSQSAEAADARWQATVDQYTDGNTIFIVVNTRLLGNK